MENKQNKQNSNSTPSLNEKIELVKKALLNSEEKNEKNSIHLNNNPDDNLAIGEQRPEFELERDSRNKFKYYDCPFCGEHKFTPFVYKNNFRDKKAGDYVDFSVTGFGMCFKGKCKFHNGIYPSYDNGYRYSMAGKKPSNVSSTSVSFTPNFNIINKIKNFISKKSDNISKEESKISNYPNIISNYSTPILSPKNIVTSTSTKSLPYSTKTIATVCNYDTITVDEIKNFTRKGKQNIVECDYYYIDSNDNKKPVNISIGVKGTITSINSSLKTNLIIPTFTSYKEDDINKCLREMLVRGGLTKTVIVNGDVHRFDATLYYYFDTQIKVRTARIIYYDADGKRFKPEKYKKYDFFYAESGLTNPYNTYSFHQKDQAFEYTLSCFNCSWLHTMIDRERQRQLINQEEEEEYQKFNMQLCLFGLPKLMKMIKEEGAKNVEVRLVEGEKNAVIANLLYPEYAWLATGGSTGFSKEMLMDLKNLEIDSIVAIPDKDATELWQKNAIKISNELNLDIQVTDALMYMNCIGDTGDMADLIIYDVKNNTHYADSIVKG